MRISEWSSDVCSSDLLCCFRGVSAVESNICLDEGRTQHRHPHSRTGKFSGQGLRERHHGGFTDVVGRHQRRSRKPSSRGHVDESPGAARTQLWSKYLTAVHDTPQIAPECPLPIVESALSTRFFTVTHLAIFVYSHDRKSDVYEQCVTGWG